VGRDTLYRNVLDGKVFCLHEGRLAPLHPVDLASNARHLRGSGTPRPDEPPVLHLPKSAADRAFERDFRPVISADGGFHDPDPHKPEKE